MIFFSSQIMNTVHEPIPGLGQDPSIEVRVAATDIAHFICKCCSIKSQLKPLYSFSKGLGGKSSAGFPRFALLIINNVSCSKGYINE